MKKILCTIFVTVCLLTRLWGQGSGPYAAFGCEGTVLDVPAASDGIFEYANADTSSECRKILLDTKLHIVAFLDKNDSVLHTAAVRREMMLRWFAPDPANQYWSGYVAMGNNPVSMVDPDGRKDNDYSNGKDYIPREQTDDVYLTNSGRVIDANYYNNLLTTVARYQSSNNLRLAEKQRQLDRIKKDITFRLDVHQAPHIPGIPELYIGFSDVNQHYIPENYRGDMLTLTSASNLGIASSQRASLRAGDDLLWSRSGVRRFRDVVELGTNSLISMSLSRLQPAFGDFYYPIALSGSVISIQDL